MMHVTEEEMIQEFYGESDNPAAVERHLAACAQCARSFAELKRDLADVSRIEAPPRDAGYGERVWAAIAPALPGYASQVRRKWAGGGWATRWWTNPWMKGLSYAAGCALLVSCAFYAGRLSEQHKQQPIAKIAPPPQQAKQPIVVVVLDDHLDRSERFLVQLKHADVESGQTAWPLGDEARSLLAANRVCRKNLGTSSDPELATALDHLDSLLAETANEPGGLNAASIARLQDEMNADGLLFEVRVLRTRMTHPAGGDNSTKGGTI
jgi:hypothetical protein